MRMLSMVSCGAVLMFGCGVESKPDAGDPFAELLARSGGGGSSGTAGGGGTQGGGGMPGPGPGAGPMPTDAGVVDDVNALLKASHVGPQVVAWDGAQLSQLLIFSLQATWANTGMVQTTGTVTWASIDTATWQAGPADRLVVVNPQGGRAEFQVRVVQTDNPNEFFRGNWALDFHVTVANKFDLDLTGQSTQGSFTGSGRGTVTVDGVVNQVDVRSVGTTYFESDSTGSEYRNQYRLTGTLSRGIVTRQVDEQWTFRMVTSRLNGRTSSASDAVRVDSGSLRIGADEYRWTNCRTAKAFTDGKPSQESFWSARCDAFTRNGAPFAQYRVTTQNFGQSGGFIGFVADFVTGGSVELERWQAY
ncbi:MAG: hypothetical protein QM817_34740 [Archangium sp.]